MAWEYSQRITGRASVGSFAYRRISCTRSYMGHTTSVAAVRACPCEGARQPGKKNRESLGFEPKP